MSPQLGDRTPLGRSRAKELALNAPRTSVSSYSRAVGVPSPVREDNRETLCRHNCALPGQTTDGGSPENPSPRRKIVVNHARRFMPPWCP